MKFTCDALSLKKGLNIAQKAITGKIATPIMSGIFMEAKDSMLTLRGSDLSISIETKIPVTIEVPGSVLINAKIISDLMGKLVGNVTMYEEGQEVFIKSGDNNTYNVPKMNVNDFPSFPQVDAKNQIELSDEDFCDLVYMTEFACATDESRPLFTGILVELKNGKITFVGTNTHRLAIKSQSYESEEFSCVIPGKVMTEVRNIASSYEEKQTIYLGILYNQVMISLGDTRIVTRLLDGRFPDYNRVIPKTFTLAASADREGLLKILDRVVLFSRTNDHSTVKLNFSNNNLYISASGADIGSANEEIPCEMDGNDLKIAFNAAYLTDVLKHSKKEKVTFRLNSSLTPGVIDNGDENYFYVITPVRTL